MRAVLTTSPNWPLQQVDFGTERPEATCGFPAGDFLIPTLDNWDRRATQYSHDYSRCKRTGVEAVLSPGWRRAIPLGRSLENPADLEKNAACFYVGMNAGEDAAVHSYGNTRARLGGRQSIRSRFVDELPDRLSLAGAPHHDECVWGVKP